ncbi:MAG: PPC domain-containing protein [Planctomycetales bacterium]|nr:PPC domain-containing protein [Planctomycetales bacterium]
MSRSTRAFAILPMLPMLIALAFPVAAESASPALTRIDPRGCQRGAEHDLVFVGARLEDAQEILFYSPGFEVLSLEPAAASVKVKVKVAPDCRLGEHVAQVRTATGISEYRTFFVGALPAVDEKEPNTEFEAAQPISANVTVQGLIGAEDVDYFVIDAKKGERISVEVEGMRLGTTLFDPYIAILDAKRFALAVGDDTPLVRQDAVCSVVAPEDGKYYVEMRDSAYGGNGASFYRLHIGNFPRPLAVYPAGGKASEPTEVTFIGDPTGEHKQTIQVPAEADDDFAVHAENPQGVSPTGNPFRVFPHGNVLEVEPNNGFGDATPAELPLAFNGVIQADGDVDCFKFAAKKGQVFEVECYGRRIRSPLDPVLNLYTADGRSIAGNDDSRGPDSYLRFTAPADGEYIARVTDHLSRGGPEFVYRIEFTAVQPSLTLSIPRVSRYEQTRQQIVIPRGNRFGTLLTVSRANFGGDVTLDPAGLPPGVTMHYEPIPGNLSTIGVVFEAAADAPVGGGLINFQGEHVNGDLKVRGGFTNRADFVIGQPGQSLYVWKDVAKLPIAVTEEAPFKLSIVQPKAPLVRSGSLNLKVVAERKEGFTAPITIEFPFRPPGVSGASRVTIPEGKTEVDYPLNAAGNAEVKEWPVYVTGVGANIWASSQMAKLKVVEPYVQFAAQRASTEQGKPTQIYCKLNQLTPFEGEAKVVLLGLPPKTTTTELTFTKETTELSFPITVDPASPVGKHKNLICRVTLLEQGEPVVGTAGVTELQIDQPLPPPKDTPPQPKVAAAPTPKPEPKPATEKPLSRLEKLRQAAREAGGE